MYCKYIGAIVQHDLIRIQKCLYEMLTFRFCSFGYNTIWTTINQSLLFKRGERTS